MKNLFLLAAAGSAIFISKAALAKTLFDNGPTDQRNGSEMTHWIETDDFILSEPARLDKVTFWDLEITGYFSGSIVWQIYSDNAGLGPGQLLYSGSATNLTHTATGLVVTGFKEFVNSFDIVPISLARGTYWLGLHNGPLPNNSTQNVFWEASATGQGAASHARVAPYVGFWTSNAYPPLPPDLAFQLSGVSSPHAATLSIQNGVAGFSFTTTSGYVYRVEYKNSLTEPWSPLPGAQSLAGSGAAIQVIDPDAGARNKRFYRAALSYDGVTAVISDFGLDNGRPRVSFSTTAGYYYRVEYKDSLSDSAWVPVSGAEIIAGTGETVQIVDSDPNLTAQSHRFYRLTIF